MSHQCKKESDSEGSETRSDEDLRTKIFSVLKLVRTPSAFAYSSVLTSLPNPGLNVPPHGFLGLPLATNEAQKIISQASQSPFGKGEETLIDTNVRKSWELNANQFSLKNPAWSKVMEDILDAVTTGLGLEKRAGMISAERYKLLLYGPGGFFKPHKDSEKTPGMFATLVVCLPSPHEGGKLVLTHEDEKYEFETASSSMFDYSYAVWYSDVTHEVLPVVSGYRLMLTYNLVRRSGFEIPSYSLVHGHLKQLSTLLEEYNSRLENKAHELPPFLLHKLEHKYTKANLKFDTLKPRDVAPVQALQQLSTKLGFDIYLAVLVLTIERDEEYNSFEEKSQQLDNIVELNGKLVVDRLDYPEGALIDPRPQDEGQADEEDHPGYSGNASVPSTYWYRDTVVVLVPPSKQLNFEIRSKFRWSIFSSLSPFNKLWQEYSQYPALKPKLEELCELAVKQKPKKNRYDSPESSKRIHPSVQQAAATALELGRIDLFNEACKTTEDRIILGNARILGRCTANHGSTAMTEPLMKGVRVATSVAEMIEFLKAVTEGFNTAVPKPDATERVNLKQWSDEAIFTAVAELKKLTKDDCKFLAQLCKTMDWSQFELQAKPFLLTAVITTKITFIKELMAILQEPDAKQRPFIEMVIRNIWDKFAFDVIESSSNNPVYLNEHDVCDIITNTITILSSECVEMLIIPAMLKAIPDASKVCSKEVFTTLVRMIIKNEITCFMLPDIYTIPPPSHKRFVQALLTKFLLANVGLEPQPPTDWSLPPRSCNCDDCSVVNKFLQDPCKESFRFPCAQARRDHLTKNFIDYSTVSITTTKEMIPYVWRITKHRQAYEKAKSEWTTSFQIAVKTLSELKNSEPKAGRLAEYLKPYYSIIMTAGVKELPDITSLVTLSQSSKPDENTASASNQSPNQICHKREASDIYDAEDGLAKRTKS